MKLQPKPRFQITPNGSLGWVVPVNPFAGLVHVPDNLPMVREYSQYLSPYPLDLNFDSVAHVDWMRATATGSDILFAVTALPDLLQYDDYGVLDSDFQFSHSPKGMHGYPLSVKISVVTDSGLVGVGVIAYELDPMSSNCGVMLDLSGQFFTYIRTLSPMKTFRLFEFLTGYGFRLTRIDLALDLDGEYCRLNSITVPTLLSDTVDAGLLASSFSRNGSNLSIATLGDWSGMTLGRYPYTDYCPDTHSPKGLTFNAGSRKSPNFFRVYEKSKQLISVADLGDDHDLDKWAVRVEHEIKRDKDGAPIPFEMLLDPDAFFGLNRPGLTDLFVSYGKYLASSFVLRRGHRERFARHALLSLKAKIFWGKRSYGRLLRSLLDQGISELEVFDMLSRDTGLKDFVFDVFDLPVNDFLSVPTDEYFPEMSSSDLAFYDSLDNSFYYDYFEV